MAYSDPIYHQDSEEGITYNTALKSGFNGQYAFYWIPTWPTLTRRRCHRWPINSPSKIGMNKAAQYSSESMA